MSAVDRTSLREVEPRHAWMALLLPRDARTFHTDDAAISRTLTAAGAVSADVAPDIEIVHDPDELQGSADFAFVPFYGRPRGSQPRAIRGFQRVRRAAQLRRHLGHACRLSRRAGYGNASFVSWDRAMPVSGRGVPRMAAPRLAHRFPSNGVVVARRGQPTDTIFDAVVRAAEDMAQRNVAVRRVGFGSAGAVIADVGFGILRTALGPASGHVDSQRRVLVELAAIDPPKLVASRVPRLLAHGREGLALWTLEEYIPGVHPLGRVTDTLQAECVEFLVELARIPVYLSYSGRVERAARTVEAASSNAFADAVHEIAEHTLDELRDWPGCFVHGDFWSGNLLAASGRLTGVIDWDSGGPDGFALLDLLHLHVGTIRERTGEPLGAVVARDLLAIESSADAEPMRSYCARLGIDVSPRKFRAVALAYWLCALAQEYEHSEPSTYDGSTVREDVTSVLRALPQRGGGEPVC